MKLLEVEGTSFDFNQKIFLKCLFFTKKQAFETKKLTVKTMDNGNFKHSFPGTMILHLQTY